MANAWDQQPDEPDEAYARFATYLAMGPGRSVAAAQILHGNEPAARPSKARAKNSAKKRTRSGTWTTDARAWNWCDRAGAWDANRGRLMVERCEHVVSHLYHDALVQLLQSLATKTPRSYLQVLEGFRVLMAHYGPIVQSYVAPAPIDGSAPAVATIPFAAGVNGHARTGTG